MNGIMSTEWPRDVRASGAVVSTWIGGTDMAQRTCSIPDCERPHYARGMCNAHYQRRQDGREMGSPILCTIPTSGWCSVDGCSTRIQSRGYCAMHYARWNHNGSPHVIRVGGPIVTPAAERVLARVDHETSGCWTYLGGASHGYGHVYIDGRSRKAHRVVYEWLVGPIPNGLQLDHLCRNTRCVNPMHLEPVTASVNTRRAYAARMVAL